MTRSDEVATGQMEARDIETAVLRGVLRGLKAWVPLETGARALLQDLAEAFRLPAATLWRAADGALKPAASWATHAWELPGGAPESTGAAALHSSLDREVANVACSRREPLYRRSGVALGHAADGAPGARRASLAAFVAIPAKLEDEVLAVAVVYGLSDVRAEYPSLAFLEIIAELLGELLDRWRLQREQSRLTPRERETLTLASHGLTTVKIAEQLALSPSTVKTHFEHIREKLQVPDRTAAVAMALRSGMID